MIPFGISAGDFVAGLSLIKSLIDALNGTFGAKSEYQGLITELYCLERALVAIVEIEVQENSSEYDATQQAVRGCRECIDRFLLRIASYQSLTAGSSSIKDHLRKIRWAQCRKEDLHKFKEDLNVYVAAINVLLHTLQLSGSKQARVGTIASIDAQANRLHAIENAIENSGSTQTEILQKIGRLLQDCPAQDPKNLSSSFVVRPLRLIEAPIAPNFVPRPAVMRAMEEHLLPLSPGMQKLLVLSGPGGIGKSQLVRDYAMAHQNDYDSLFWVDGRSEQGLRTSMARMAELIPLPFVLDADNRVPKNEGGIDKALHAVDAWLTSAGNRRWLIVIDNIDAYDCEDGDEVNFDVTGRYDVAKYIPAVAQGYIVITSRLSFLARNIGARNISVGEMEEKEALQVLHRASGRPYNEKGSVALINKLGSYPLAVVQAANYIYENHTTTQTYLKRYDENTKILMEHNLTRREYTSRSIDVALRLSFETLESRNPEAAAFLLFCGFLDNKVIFWKFLNVAYIFAGAWPDDGGVLSFDDSPSVPFKHLRPSWLDEIARSEAIFDSVVKALCELSFIRWNEESDGFSIHSVIHEWIISHIDWPTKTQLSILAANIVASNFGARSDIPAQRIQPSANRVVHLGHQGNGYPVWTFTSLLLLGAFYYDNEELQRAEQLISCALDKVALAFGKESSMFALWCMRIGPLFIEPQSLDTYIGRLEVAESKLLQSINVHPKDHHHRLDLCNHLCYAYQKHGDYEKAVELGRRSLDDVSTISVDLVLKCCATGLLAESYLAIGWHETAKSYATTAVQQHEKIFGLDPEDGSLSAWRRRNMTIMAIACSHLYKYELAELLLVSVHTEAVRFHGPDHAMSLHAYHNLECLHAVKSRQGLSKTLPSPHRGTINSEELSDLTLSDLCTDINITYFRFDLAMPLFETLETIDRQIRGANKALSSDPTTKAEFESSRPLALRLAGAACSIQ